MSSSGDCVAELSWVAEYCSKHGRQNVWEQGNILGCWNVSKQIGQSVKCDIFWNIGNINYGLMHVEKVLRERNRGKAGGTGGGRIGNVLMGLWVHFLREGASQEIEFLQFLIKSSGHINYSKYCRTSEKQLMMESQLLERMVFPQCNYFNDLLVRQQLLTEDKKKAKCFMEKKLKFIEVEFYPALKPESVIIFWEHYPSCLRTVHPICHHNTIWAPEWEWHSHMSYHSDSTFLFSPLNTEKKSGAKTAPTLEPFHGT